LLRFARNDTFEINQRFPRSASERFRNACIVGIRIETFKGELLADLERMESVDERALLDIVDLKRKEFEKYQEELIGMLMPMEVSVQQGVQPTPTSGATEHSTSAAEKSVNRQGQQPDS
jgi:hypothetical protein